MGTDCIAFWRSHGCYLPRGHARWWRLGLDHRCDPCPPDCTAPRQDMTGMAKNCGDCSYHCGDRPLLADRLRGSNIPAWVERLHNLGFQIRWGHRSPWTRWRMRYLRATGQLR